MVRRDRQSMMFSATFANEVQCMAMDFLNEYLFVSVGRVGAAATLVTQKVVYTPQDQDHKLRSLEKALVQHLPKDGLAIVFVATKKGADELENILYGKGLQVAAIHGDRPQDERKAAMTAFKAGRNPVLIATDVVGRGIHIDNVRLVINFEMPNKIDDYVHRIGRTGRAGNTGVAVSLINENCRCLHDLQGQLAKAKQEIPDWFDDLCNRGPVLRLQAERAVVNDVRDVNKKSLSADRGSGVTRQKDCANVTGWGLTGQIDAW